MCVYPLALLLLLLLVCSLSILGMFHPSYFICARRTVVGMCWYWRIAIKVNMSMFVPSEFLMYVTPKNCKLLLLHTVSAEVFLQKFDFRITSLLSLKLYASFLLEGFRLQRSYLTFQIYYFSLHILITHKIENAQKAIIKLNGFFPPLPSLSRFLQLWSKRTGIHSLF